MNGCSLSYLSQLRVLLCLMLEKALITSKKMKCNWNTYAWVVPPAPNPTPERQMSSHGYPGSLAYSSEDTGIALKIPNINMVRLTKSNPYDINEHVQVYHRENDWINVPQKHTGLISVIWALDICVWCPEPY